VNFFKADSFIFNQKESGSLNPYTDLCTFPSIPYAAVRANLGTDDQWWQSLAFDLLSAFATTPIRDNVVPENEANPFIKISVHEYIWGYDSKLLFWVNSTFASILNKTVDPFFNLQKNSTSMEYTRQKKVGRDVMFTGKMIHLKLTSMQNGKANLI